jgi:hypothetical protein
MRRTAAASSTTFLSSSAMTNHVLKSLKTINRTGGTKLMIPTTHTKKQEAQFDLLRMRNQLSAELYTRRTEIVPTHHTTPSPQTPTGRATSTTPPNGPTTRNPTTTIPPVRRRVLEDEDTAVLAEEVEVEETIVVEAQTGHCSTELIFKTGFPGEKQTALHSEPSTATLRLCSPILPVTSRTDTLLPNYRLP